MTEIDIEALAEAYERGLAREKAGDVPAAIAAYREALALDPDDRGGVSVRLAALGAADPPPAAPPAYVATLFDQTAARFDDILVEQLGYSVPMQLRERLEARGVRALGRVLDLGCGTGLSGIALADIAGEIVGVDLSEEMLAEADERGVYAELYIGEAVAFLEAQGLEDAPFDAIVATDMLPYLGEVAPLFAAAARALAPGGLLAVSTETLPEAATGARGYAVGPGQRYGHAEGYLAGALAAAGFAAEPAEPIVVRYNEGRPVAGHLLLARRR